MRRLTKNVEHAKEQHKKILKQTYDAQKLDVLKTL